MGDGEGIWMTKAEITEDVYKGMEDAVVKGKSQPLEPDDLDRLVEILTMPEKNVSVERGNEGVTTFDAGTLKLCVRQAIPIDRNAAVLIHERALCSEMMELCNTDYSFKAIKNIAAEEAMAMEHAQMNCIIPLFYGAMPEHGSLHQAGRGRWTTGPSFFRRDISRKPSMHRKKRQNYA